MRSKKQPQSDVPLWYSPTATGEIPETTRRVLARIDPEQRKALEELGPNGSPDMKQMAFILGILRTGLSVRVQLKAGKFYIDMTSEP